MNYLRITKETENPTAIINEFLESADKTQPTSIEFEKGTYRFTVNGSKKGSNPGVNGIIFPFEQMTDVTVDGGGSEFIFCDRVQPFIMKHTNGITLKNFSMDFSFLRYAFADVIEASDSGIEIKLDEKLFNCQVNDGALLFDCGAEMLSTEMRKISTKRIFPTKSGVFFLYVGNFKKQYNKAAPNVLCDAEKTEEGFLLRYREGAQKVPFTAGDRICMGYDNDREMTAISAVYCNDIVIKDVTIFRQGGMGFVPTLCKNILLDGFRIMLKEGREEYYSTTADGIYPTNCYGEFIMRNCTVTDTYDDALNVHGFYTTVKNVISDTEAELTFLHPEHCGLRLYSEGDTLLVSTPGDFMQIGAITINKLTYGEGGSSIIIKHDGNLALISGMLLENRSKMPRVTIENCRVERCPHIRMSAPFAKISDSYFDLTAENLYIYDLIDFWGECGAVEEMLIENNRFGALAETSITIGSCRPKSSNHLHERITVRNNVFAKPKDEAIHASHVKELVLEGNTFGVKA